MDFLKDDVVRVWSLQSFSGGGFLNGVDAIVRQDQLGDSVILRLVRNQGGQQAVDNAYEVYARQCELVKRLRRNPFSFTKRSTYTPEASDGVVDFHSELKRLLAR